MASAAIVSSEEPSVLVLQSFESVLSDEGFKVPSPQAKEATKIASAIVVWCKAEENKEQFMKFSQWLITSFDKCFKSYRSLRVKREKMWEEYHRLRTSTAFQQAWDKFTTSSVAMGCRALPAFYQFTANFVFTKVIEGRFPVTNSPEDDQISPITWEEENALRYVAGYVCRKVQTNLKSSKLSNKDDLILFITDLSGDEMEETRGTETWTNNVDRGGLWHVNDDTYTVFYLIEEEIRKHFKVKDLQQLGNETKKTTLTAIMENEDLLFMWSLLSATVDESDGIVVLKMIAELYLTVRGFAFASSCLELYKGRNKKQIQKSKALRRKLLNTTDNEES